MGDQSGVAAEAMVHHAFRILLQAQGPSSAVPSNRMNFNPSMAIIIIVLISAFLFMGFFSIYVRRCTRSDDNSNATPAQQAARNSAAARSTQGLDRAVVEALPLVGYSLVKGLKGGKDLCECAVCLSDFEDEDNLRLLPKCGHVFHPDCIDMWFYSHSTCPLCRASLIPPEAKEGVEGETEDAHFSEEYQNWVSSRGVGPNGETFTIHDGPPLPPNGSILELLSRDGADRMLAESLRMTGERLDAGLARREGEEENSERAVGIRALNRALSRNSASFRNASRGLEAGDRIDAVNNTGSARFNSSSVVINIDGVSDPGRASKKARSFGSSRSFNMALLRSSSLGSSGIRQFFSGGQEENDGFRSKLLGSEHKLPTVNRVMRRERSANELRNIGVPVWEDVDLNAESGVGANATTRPTVPGALPPERWASRGRKFFSGEVPMSPGAKRMEPSGEPSVPFYSSGKEKESQVGERTKSDRWNFGQSFRRTFSLKRSTSSVSDVESSNNSKPVYTQMVQPGSSAASKPKKFSPWTGAMKIKRTTSGGADGLPSPHSPSSLAFSESFPVDPVPQSRTVEHPSVAREQQQQQQQNRQQQQQQQDQPPSKDDPITIVTQP